MFEQFLKNQSHAFHVEVWPDRIQTRELTSGEAVEDAPVIALEMRDKKPIVKEIGEAAKPMPGMDKKMDMAAKSGSALPAPTPPVWVMAIVSFAVLAAGVAVAVIFGGNA